MNLSTFLDEQWSGEVRSCSGGCMGTVGMCTSTSGGWCMDIDEFQTNPFDTDPWPGFGQSMGHHHNIAPKILKGVKITFYLHF